jgi:CRISPR-associated protein (TIGR02710 family)
MNEATDSFRKLHSVLVTDLLSNARRRYRQHKYDDAVARLYRALEMVGQVAFEQRTGCSTSRVDEEKIPALLREEYTARYGYKEAGKLKLGLFATFNVLAEMGDSAGLAFRNNERELRKLLDARNLSILAHGKNPVERETYESLESFMVKLFQIGDFIEFPQLNW